MAMEYNTSPISLREAKVMLDGLVVADAVKATIKFTPDVWSGKQLAGRQDHRRDHPAPVHPVPKGEGHGVPEERQDP